MGKEFSAISEMRQHVAESIRRLREASDQTQHDFSLRCGLPRMRIQRLETGKYNLSLMEFVMISSALKVDVATIVGLDAFRAFDQRVKDLETETRLKHEAWMRTPDKFMQPIEEK